MQKLLFSKIIPFLVICHCMVSMATHNAVLENGDVPTKILISQQQLFLQYLTLYQINS